MKKRFIVFIAIFIILAAQSAGAYDRLPIPDLDCESAIIMDAATGNVLYQKNAGQKLYPASTTKILTAALALEMESGGKTTTISTHAVKAIGIDGSNADLKKGEKYTLSELINMALVYSANDAANAIAEAVSGSTLKFADLMNKKVKELGLTNTTFLNPIGLDVEDGFSGHMTTARDLAHIMRYATSIDEVREIIGKTSYQNPRSDKAGSRSVFKSTNLLLTSTRYKSEDYEVIGGKTGYTKAARNVFAGCARNKDGIELIIVLMKNSDRMRMFDDAKSLFDYGFDLVEAQPVIAEEGFFDIRYRPSEKAINELLQRGILSGNGQGEFNYSALATKEMFIKVLMDIRGTEKPAISSSSWSESHLNSAARERLIDETWLSQRSAPVTRGDVIRVLGKLIDLKFKDSDALALAVYFNDYETMDQELRNSSLEVCILGIVPYIREGALNAGKSMSREELMMILTQYEKTLSIDAMNNLY